MTDLELSFLHFHMFVVVFSTIVVNKNFQEKFGVDVMAGHDCPAVSQAWHGSTSGCLHDLQVSLCGLTKQSLPLIRSAVRPP